MPQNRPSRMSRVEKIQIQRRLVQSLLDQKLGPSDLVYGVTVGHNAVQIEDNGLQHGLANRSGALVCCLQRPKYPWPASCARESPGKSRGSRKDGHLLCAACCPKEPPNKDPRAVSLSRQRILSAQASADQVVALPAIL